MRRGRGTTILLGAVMALLAFILLFLGLGGGGRAQPGPVSTPTAEPTAQVVVTTKDIRSFTIVKAADVTIKEVKQSEVISGATSLPSDVVGKVLMRDYNADR